MVLTFDVTSELSFLDLRGWIHSIRQGVDEDTPIMLLANKIDLLTEGCDCIRVERGAAERMAKVDTICSFTNQLINNA